MLKAHPHYLGAAFALDTDYEISFQSEEHFNSTVLRINRDLRSKGEGTNDHEVRLFSRYSQY